MIFTGKGNSASQQKIKKKPFLPQLGEDALASSLSCEFGPDGIKFLRANINITKNGMCKVAGDQVVPISVVKAEDVEFEGEVGRGASGSVHAGIYKPDNYPIAIKTISVYDKGKRHQVVNDLNIFLHDRVEQLNGNTTELSNHLVQVYGAFYDEGSIRIIMELMDAGSLRNLLNMAKAFKTTGPCIEEPYLANIAYQLLSGLFYIHTKKKQIHRDIKPENVLINTQGQVKLTDFGISKQLEQTHGFSKTFVGTVTYMSPERLTGEPYAFPSDLWSLGLVLIELATGEYPYKKTKTFIEMLENITTIPEPNVPDNGLYSDEFRDFIRRCLNKDPAKRSTAAELMEHPWLVYNSGLNYDFTEWLGNLIFRYKYGCEEKLQQMDCYDEEYKINGESNFESTDDSKGGDGDSSVTRFSNFEDVYDNTNNLFATSNRLDSPFQAEFHNQIEYLRKEMSSGSQRNSQQSSATKAKRLPEMDLEVENLE